MSTNNKLTITIMAGGLGKRMESTLPKVLHEVKGKPMLVRIIENSLKLNPHKILVVVGKYKPVIEETLSKWNVLNRVEFAIQEIAKGTGHAILCTLNHLSNGEDDFNIILNGDCPMLHSDTISDIISVFQKNNTKLQISCIDNPTPHGSGRIIKDSDGNFLKIVEEKDCNYDERMIKTINIGIYVANNRILKKYIPMIDNKNIQKEYYLTDIVEIFRNNEDSPVGLIELDKSKLSEIKNVNTKKQLEELNSLVKI